MNSNNFKSKKEIVANLGMSMRTFQRRLEKSDLDVPRGLISPKKQQEIYKVLGLNINKENTLA